MKGHRRSLEREARSMTNKTAYDYEVASGWTLVDNYIEDGYAVFVYAYGSGSELVALLPGESTSPLVDAGVTMRSSITGAEFNNMTDIDIQVDGFLIDSGVGLVPEDVILTKGVDYDAYGERS